MKPIKPIETFLNMRKGSDNPGNNIISEQISDNRINNQLTGKRLPINQIPYWPSFLSFYNFCRYITSTVAFAKIGFEKLEAQDGGR